MYIGGLFSIILLNLLKNNLKLIACSREQNKSYPLASSNNIIAWHFQAVYLQLKLTDIFPR